MATPHQSLHYPIFQTIALPMQGGGGMQQFAQVVTLTQEQQQQLMAAQQINMSALQQQQPQQQQQQATQQQQQEQKPKEQTAAVDQQTSQLPPTKKRTREEEEALKQMRQERNRWHAKRCRERKKAERTQLQQEAEKLRQENEQLKIIIKEKISGHYAKAILGECSKLHQTDYQLIENLAASKQSFCMTDPRLPDNPIVYVSDKFCKLTGFPREQAIGRNCRFLQGPQTDPKAVAVVRNAIARGTDCTTVMLNYKADGTPFWNRFFIAALRDWDGNITNYVGVQCQYEGGPEAMEEESLLQNIPAKLASPIEPVPMNTTSMEEVRNRRKMDLDNHENETIEEVDWSLLAELLEDDFREDISIEEILEDNPPEPVSSSSAIAPASSNSFPLITQASNLIVPEPKEDTEDFYDNNIANLELFAASPHEVATKTVRSDLITTLLASGGDVTDDRFLSALSVLSTIYKCSGQNASCTNLHNGNWRSISSPHYGECLGQNKDGDFLYSLGKMSFGMFKPGHLICSVQRTMNHIETVCEMDGAPSAAPWSLRRELAAWDQADESEIMDATAIQLQQEQQSATMLKSYDIAVALTVESEQDPSSTINYQKDARLRLRALNVTQGYMLPDPDTPNRLTVWFTGGKLSPAPQESDGKQEKAGYGGPEKWKAIFGKKHKRTWGESFRVMGAKLLLGAELPDGMEADGTMRYVLHRPVGGHGRNYVDVLYLDDRLLILKSSSGIVHVMVRSAGKEG